MDIKSQKGRLKISDDGWTMTVAIKRKYEWATILFFVFIIVFLTGMIYLLNIAETQSENESGSFFLIMSLIFKGIGSILIIGMIHELLKREFIELTPNELAIKEKVLYKVTFSRKYDWNLIHHLQEAPPPVRGWKLADNYKSTFHSRKTYSNDFRKVYPTVRFEYNREFVDFANGLSAEEAKYLINLIKGKNYGKHLN